MKPGAQPIPVKPGAAPLPREADLEEENEEGKTPDAVKAAPPWLVSLVVHMVVLIVLGLILLPLNLNKNVELEVTWAEEEGVQLEDDLLDTNLMEQLEITEPMLSIITRWSVASYCVVRSTRKRAALLPYSQ